MPINPQIPLSVQGIPVPDILGRMRQRQQLQQGQMTMQDMLAQREQAEVERQKMQRLSEALAGAFDENGQFDYDKGARIAAQVGFPDVAVKIATAKPKPVKTTEQKPEPFHYEDLGDRVEVYQGEKLVKTLKKGITPHEPKTEPPPKPDKPDIPPSVLFGKYYDSSKGWKQAKLAYKSMAPFFQNPSAMSDYALRHQFITLISPRAQLRQGVLQDAAKAQGIQDKVAAQIENWTLKGGAQLGPTARKALQTLSQSYYDDALSEHRDAATAAWEQAKLAGTDPRIVVPDYKDVGLGENAPAKTMTEADVKATAKASGRTEQQVRAAARAKGIQVVP